MSFQVLVTLKFYKAFPFYLLWVYLDLVQFWHHQSHDHSLWTPSVKLSTL